MIRKLFGRRAAPLLSRSVSFPVVSEEQAMRNGTWWLQWDSARRGWMLCFLEREGKAAFDLFIPCEPDGDMARRGLRHLDCMVLG